MDKLIDWLLELAKSKKRPIAVLAIAIAVGLYAYWNWDHVKELPGIVQIVDVIAHHRPLPTPVDGGLKWRIFGGKRWT
jgi:hypothetical protein